MSARAVGEKVQLLFLDAAFHIPTSTVKVLWFKTTAALNSGVTSKPRGQFPDALNRNIGQAGQHAGQVLSNRGSYRGHRPSTPLAGV